MKAAITMSNPLDKQPNIYEYAVGNIVDRSIFRSDDYQKELFCTKEAYRSIFSYDESIISHQKENRTDQPTILVYGGNIGANELIISINSNAGDLISSYESASRKTFALVKQFETNYGLLPSELRLEFDGFNGFRIRIPASKFGGFKPSINMRKYHLALCLKLTEGLEGIDQSIYKDTYLMSIQNTKNCQTSLYSIPIECNHFFKIGVLEFLENAKQPNISKIDVPPSSISSNEKLTSIYKGIIETIDQNEDNNTSPENGEQPQTPYPDASYDDIVKVCIALSEIVTIAGKEENLGHQERIFLGTLSLGLGIDGRLMAHSLLSKQKNYDAEETNEQLKSLAENADFHNICNLICPKKCNTMRFFRSNTPLAIYFGMGTKYNQSFALNRMIKIFGDDLLFKSEQNCFYLYDQGVFKEINDNDLHSMLNTFLWFISDSESITNKTIDALRKRMKMSENLSYTGELNPIPHVLNLKNGMFDMKTGEFLPHSPDYRSTVQLNIEYDPKAKCELFSEKLNEIFDGDTDKLEYFKLWMLYCFMPTYQYQKLLILYGTGRNGKSVLMNLLSAMIGTSNCSYESISDIAKENGYSVIHLKDKLVNISMELSTKETETDTIKRLTGGDIISCRQIYKERIHFRNTARLIISTNSLPRVANLDKAFLGRMEIIEFTKSFVNNPDTELDQKLIKEIPGIFNLLIENRTKIFREDGSIRLQMPESLKGTIKKLSSNLHSVTEFVSENCELIVLDPTKSDRMIPMKNLYTAYADWCKESGYFACGKKLFKEVIEANSDSLVRKLTYVTTRNRVQYKNAIWILGVALTDDLSSNVSCRADIRAILRDNPDESITFNESSYLAELDQESLSRSKINEKSSEGTLVIENSSAQDKEEFDFFKS